MDAGTLILLLVLLACPLAMFFMHGRGGHGQHAHGTQASPTPSLDELRRRRSTLDAQIRALEREKPAPRKRTA